MFRVAQKRSDEHRLTAGQMLLQAFDGLFCAVQKEFLSLLSARERFNFPREWAYVAALSEPLQLQKFKNLSGQLMVLRKASFSNNEKCCSTICSLFLVSDECQRSIFCSYWFCFCCE